jgi:hypothetical protein
MRVYSNATLRFTKPGVSLLTAPASPTGDATQMIGKQPEFAEAFFDIPPNKFVDVPDWIRDQPLFKLAVADETLRVVESPAPVVAVPEPVVTNESDEAANREELAAKDAAEKAATKKNVKK